MWRQTRRRTQMLARARHSCPLKEQRCIGTRFEHQWSPLTDWIISLCETLGLSIKAFQWFIERSLCFAIPWLSSLWKGLSYIFLGFELQLYPEILFAFGWNWAQWFWTRFSYYNGRLSSFWQEYGFLFEYALCWVCCAFHHIASVIILNEVDGLHL